MASHALLANKTLILKGVDLIGREQFQRKWAPVSRPELRQNKGIEQFQRFNLRWKSSSESGTGLAPEIALVENMILYSDEHGVIDLLQGLVVGTQTKIRIGFSGLIGALTNLDKNGRVALFLKKLDGKLLTVIRAIPAKVGTGFAFGIALNQRDRAFSAIQSSMEKL